MEFAPIILPFVDEALKVLGLWAAAPALVAVAALEVRRKLIAKDAEIATLRRQTDELQDKRLQDAREMIRIAESGTAATAARTRSDERFADLMESLLRKLAESEPGGTPAMRLHFFHRHAARSAEPDAPPPGDVVGESLRAAVREHARVKADNTRSYEARVEGMTAELFARLETHARNPS